MMLRLDLNEATTLQTSFAFAQANLAQGNPWLGPFNGECRRAPGV